MKLKNKVALITGGTSGIGLATAKAFRDEGAHVVVVGQDQARLEEARHELGAEAMALRADLRNISEIDNLIQTVRKKFGHIDVLFANAGKGTAAPLEAVTEEQIDEQFAVNFKGIFFTVQKAAPILAKGGSVVLTTSFLNAVGTPGLSILSATKAAVRSFARTWTMDLKERKIRVNAISPGPIRTPAYDRLAESGPAGRQMLESIVSRVPMGRFGTPDEIATAAVFLASDDSSFVTGTELFVDGGAAQV